MAKNLYVLDGMALVYRAHFAFARNPILTSTGVNTSALYGFTNTLLEIIQNRQPTHLAVAFDTKEPTPRHALFPAYKAQREAMPEDLAAALPAVEQLLAAMRIPVLKSPGFEADDIIGSIAAKVDEAKEDWKLFMVTPDKDFGQLVSERCAMLKPGKPGAPAEVLGPLEIQERWGISSPAQVIDVLALMGDASDNIPGIAGVGEKTAVKLIREYGGLEQTLEHADEISGKLGEKVRAGADMARLSKQLATIYRDVPLSFTLDDLEMREGDKGLLAEFFTQYEFNSIGKKMLGADFVAGRSGLKKSGESDDLFSAAERDSESDGSESAALGSEVKSIQTETHTYLTINNAKDVKKYLDSLSLRDSVCFDTETTGLDPHSSRLLGFSFSVGKGEAAWIPVRWQDEDADYAASLESLKRFFASFAGKLIGHNLKFDLSVLLQHGFTFRAEFFDTMLAHALIQPEQRHGMDYLAEVYLGYRPVALESLADGEKAKNIDMRLIAETKSAELAEYAAEDADVTWQLAGIFEKLLQKEGMLDMYTAVEGPLILPLARMELAGVALDTDTLAHLSVTMGGEIEEKKREVVLAAELDFNLNSPKQLGDVLFNRLKLLDKPKKTKTGQFVTDEATLESLRNMHPIVDAILEYRQLTKLKSTYVDALPAAVNPVTGRVHTTYHQLLTATGRLASSDPNLQNIPIRTDRGREIRAAIYSPDPDVVIFSADYSQIELRLMASMSGDANLKQAFEDGEDIHAATASRLYRVPLAEVNSDMRRAAKTVNFGIIYGISSFGLAQRLGIPRSEGASLISLYFRMYPGVKDFMETTVEQAKADGFVETMRGRKRWLRDIRDGNAVVRGRAERMAINAPLQGSAADMIKLAMIRIDRELQSRKTGARMLLQVHDELVFEIPRAELDELRPVIIRHMEEAMPLQVPVVVESGFGANWLEAH